MSTTLDTNKRPQHRSRRNNKSNRAPTDSQSAPIQSSHPSHEQANAQTTPRIQILSRNEPNMISGLSNEPSTETTAPSTPPRPAQTPLASVKHGNSVNGAAKTATSKQRNAVKTQTTQHKAAPKNGQTGTPGPVQRPNTLTPGRNSETPSRAYAGPTFHASPAASSLPMPKLFSKSVPNGNKGAGLKQMMDHNANGTVSENEESPFMDKSEPSPSRYAREESPLDIFFQADRRARAKNSPSLMRSGLIQETTRQDEGRRPDASPSRPRHHSRHPTDGANGGVFPMELETSALGGHDQRMRHQQHDQFQQPLYDRSNSVSPGFLAGRQASEQQRHEQSMDLKRMLFAQCPAGSISSTNSGTSSPRWHQPTTDTRDAQLEPLSSSPRAELSGSNAQHQAATHPIAHKQILSNGYPSQRPISSGLAKEITTNSSSMTRAEPGDLSTPTSIPTDRQKLMSPMSHHASIPAHGSFHRQNGHHVPARPQNTIDSTQNHNHNAKSTKLIEDDLRRILKLDLQ